MVDDDSPERPILRDKRVAWRNQLDSVSGRTSTESESRAGDSPAVVLETIAGELRQTDPDVVILSTGTLVPMVQGHADVLDFDLQHGR